MKNKNDKGNITILITFLSFFFIGIVVTIFGIYLCLDTYDYTNKTFVKGIIKEIDYENTYAKIIYDIDGKKYEGILNGYESRFYIGKEVEIYYDNDNYKKIGIRSLDNMAMFVPMMGIIFTVAGLFPVLKIKSRNNSKKKLLEEGMCLNANYIETIKNYQYCINGRYPYQIVCEWTNLEDRKKYIFYSDIIWYNPEKIIKSKNLKIFKVYVDKKIKDYVIDLTYLQENNS